MDSFIKGDLYRSGADVSLKTLFVRLYVDYGFRFLFFLRMSTIYSRKSFIGFICYYFYKKYSIKYQIQIPRSVKIGRGLGIPHFGGIVVNSKTIIGDNCTLFHNVTIGNTKRGKNKGTPRIGNNVYIGPGAVIVGGITIGNNVLIAPNSYVNFDVASDNIVIGNPSKLIKSESATQGYIYNELKK